jgi:putative PIN family toxin of toxin-antitoxin system
MVGICNLFPLKVKLSVRRSADGVGDALRRETGSKPGVINLRGGFRRGEPLDKERSSNLLKSLLLYSQLLDAARRVCAASTMTYESAHETPTVCPVPLDAPVVVLDTNVVLDWLLFNDPTCHALALQIKTGQIAWHTTALMRTELLSVLPRPQFLDWKPNCEYILSAFNRWSIVLPADLHAPGAAAPRCRDADDQKFIDLAYARSARWLFSRDRALLDLAKPARARGLEILTPTHWLRRYARFEHGGAAKPRA